MRGSTGLWSIRRCVRPRPRARVRRSTHEERRPMSAGCAASLSSVASVGTSRARDPTSGASGCMSSVRMTRVPGARWAAVEELSAPPSHPATGVSRYGSHRPVCPGTLWSLATSAGVRRWAFMTQSFICIDCGRTVPEVSRARCARCLPEANRERFARYGHGTGRNTPARQEHQAFITSSAWRKLRKVVIERDGHRCTRCGTAKSLTVHHIIPVRKDPSMALELDNCVTLCRSCHGRAEGGRA